CSSMDIPINIYKKWLARRRQSKGTAAPETADQDAPGITRVSSKLEGATERTVYINLPIPDDECDEHGRPKTHFTPNKIRTSKYTITTFIPKNLFEQFRRAANVYFLVTAILQLIPVFGIDNPGLAVLPICVVLFITAVKDGYEDYRRHVSDTEFNRTKTCRLINWQNRNFGHRRSDLHYLWVGFGRLLGWLGLGFLVPRPPTRVDHHIYEREDPRWSASAVPLPAGRPARNSATTPSKDAHSQAFELQQLHAAAPTGSLPSQAPLAFPAAPVPSSRRTSMYSRRSHRYSISDPHRPRFGDSIWEELYVGDIVLLQNNDAVPADMVILSTSDDDGTCYIETKNLDGETNLKSRNCLAETARVQTAFDCTQLQASIKSDPPSSNLNSYFGTMTINLETLPAPPSKPTSESVPSFEQDLSSPQAGPFDDGLYGEKVVPITIKNLLLRGCVIRNTDFVIGIIVYTGPESKIMLNSGETPSKRSRIERVMNYQVVTNFVILLILSLLLAMGATINWRHWVNDGAPWISDTESLGAVYVLTFWQTLILLQNIIPISLYVSIELVKTMQAYFMYQDLGMYYEPTDRPCIPRTWNISDDLGQVKYVFSDKTGTLTRNVMEFRKFSVWGQAYGRQLPGDELDVDRGHLGILEQQMAEDPTLPPAEAASILSMEKHGIVADPTSPTSYSYHSASLTDMSAHPSDSHLVLSPERQDTRERMLNEHKGAMLNVFHPRYIDLNDATSDAFSCVDPRVFQALRYWGQSTSTQQELTSDPRNFTRHQISQQQANRLGMFFTMLAVCHTALVEKPERRQEDIERERGNLSDDEENGNEDRVTTGEWPSLDIASPGGTQRQPMLPAQSNPPARDSDMTQVDLHPTSNPFRSDPSSPSRSLDQNPLSLESSFTHASRQSPNLSSKTGFIPINYRAESPDEGALVKAAKNFGFTFLGRNKDQVKLDILGTNFTFIQLDVIEFDSTRKRMSVIVRRPAPWNDVVLFCKGADNVIIDRLAAGQDDLRDRTLEQIDHFSNQGLRVLCLAYRILTEDEYQSWGSRYKRAQISTEGREEQLEALAEEVECQLSLIGATAIEDKLQEEVPESIAALRDAGIHVWVLTGDKLETAINIGFASSLLTRDMEVWTIRKADEETVLERFRLVANIILKQGIKAGLIHPRNLDPALRAKPKTWWGKTWRLAKFLVSGPKSDINDPGSRGWLFNLGSGPSRHSQRVVARKWARARGLRRKHVHHTRGRSFYRSFFNHQGGTRDEMAILGDNGQGHVLPDGQEVTETIPPNSKRPHHLTLGSLRRLFRNRRRLDHLQNTYGIAEQDAVNMSYHASRVSLRSMSGYSVTQLERGLSPDARLSYCGTRRYLNDVGLSSPGPSSDEFHSDDEGSTTEYLSDLDAPWTTKGEDNGQEHADGTLAPGRRTTLVSGHYPPTEPRGRRHSRRRSARQRSSLGDDRAAAYVPAIEHALVMDGTSLKFILRSELHARLLQQIAPACKSVICCRVSPLQKAQVVKLVRDYHDAVTVAIGDGANDVSMIQQADVGVAIAGEEGMQASMASDYTIGRFKYLRNLLLVHGIWCYHRISEMVLNFFYKNVVFSFATFWFQFFCGYSANFFYEYSYFQLFNLIFTSLPVIIMGVLDRPMQYKTGLRYPGLYRFGSRGTHFSMRRFWTYQLDAVWQSMVCYFTFHLLFNRGGVPDHTGRSMGQFDMSSPVVLTVVIVANFFLGIRTYSWDIIFVISVVGSILVLLAYTPVYAQFFGTDLTGIEAVIYPSGMFWLGILFAVIAALLLRYLFTFMGRTFHPEDLDILREREYYHLDDREDRQTLGASGAEAGFGPSDATPRSYLLGTTNFTGAAAPKRTDPTSSSSPAGGTTRRRPSLPRKSLGRRRRPHRRPSSKRMDKQSSGGKTGWAGGSAVSRLEHEQMRSDIQHEFSRHYENLDGSTEFPHDIVSSDPLCIAPPKRLMNPTDDQQQPTISSPPPTTS
ncbi:hypothetical protein H4R35_004332, partial [Dimargaris xerosporica]